MDDEPNRACSDENSTASRGKSCTLKLDESYADGLCLQRIYIYLTYMMNSTQVPVNPCVRSSPR